jgi:predicted O-methyltransferase YrrM
MNPEDALTLLSMIENEKEIEHMKPYLFLLEELAEMKGGYILEIGTGRGHSLVPLSIGAKNSDGHVYTVDILGDEKKEIQNAKSLIEKNKLGKYVTFITGDGGDPETMININKGKEYIRFNLVFIDSSHELDQTLKELKLSMINLNEGGIIVCHDLNIPEVRDAIGVFLMENRNFGVILEKDKDAENIAGIAVLGKVL